MVKTSIKNYQVETRYQDIIEYEWTYGRTGE